MSVEQQAVARPTEQRPPPPPLPRQPLGDSRPEPALFELSLSVPVLVSALRKTEPSLDTTAASASASAVTTDPDSAVLEERKEDVSVISETRTRLSSRVFPLRETKRAFQGPVVHTHYLLATSR